MPTPFTHLYIASRLLHDERVSAAAQAILAAHQPCFLLGGIVADQRLEGMERADTHFYHYTRPMPDNPWREMFRQHPTLMQPKSEAHHAFLMGYVAHLAADEYWSRHMLGPHFANGEWGEDRFDRFFVLHLLLIWMDERDEDRLPQETADLLRQCFPNDWLPFLPDDGICDWRDFLADQLEGEVAGVAKAIVPVADQVSSTLAEVQTLLALATSGQGSVAQALNNPDLYLSLTDASTRLEKTLKDVQLLIEKLRAEGIKIGL